MIQTPHTLINNDTALMFHVCIHSLIQICQITQPTYVSIKLHLPQRITLAFNTICNIEYWKHILYMIYVQSHCCNFLELYIIFIIKIKFKIIFISYHRINVFAFVKIRRCHFLRFCIFRL